MCKKNICEYTGTATKRQPINRTPEEIKYGQLWAEIELPKQLKRGENQ